MISLKNYKQNLLALFVCCSLVPCSSNGASQQIQQSLHKACEQGDEKEIQRLINSNANVNDLDKDDMRHYDACYKNTPLHKACCRGNLEIVKLLLKHGAGVNDRDTEQETAIHCVFYSSNKSEIIKLLLEYGAAVNAKTSVLLTALHLACTAKEDEKNRFKCLQLLIQHGAEINVRSNVGRTALNFAQRIGYHDAVAYLTNLQALETNFNCNTTPATLELLQRCIARNMYTAYVLKHFLTQPQDIQKELMKHALLHNQNILIQFYSCTNCDQLLTPNMLADNTYLQQKYAAYRKKLPLQTKADWWNTKALPFTNTTITFNK